MNALLSLCYQIVNNEKSKKGFTGKTVFQKGVEKANSFSINKSSWGVKIIDGR